MRRITLQDLIEFALFFACITGIVGWWQAL